MKIKTLLKTATLLLSLGLYAQPQRAYHWYFGGGAGIDFSSGQAVADTNGQMYVYAGNASISDENGNLLMYTDGWSVWNRNHQVMPNGTELSPDNSTPFQSSIIIPLPNNKHLYYIFHLTAFNFKDTLIRGLLYSIVDMNLDSGRGDVTIKGQMLLTPVSEALGAVYHANCQDIWVMAHKRETNDFYAYLVTENGITDTVITTIGNFIGTPYGVYGLKFSPDGSKMATSAFWDYLNDTTRFDTLHVFDFDRNTGILSNKILIPDTAIASYGFSSDNSKFYYHNGAFDAFTYQLDLSSNNQQIILSTKTLLFYESYYNVSDFQNTPLNNIIAAKSHNQYIAIIENPNEIGLACGFVDSSLYLGGRYCYVSLPNFIQSYFDSDSSTTCFQTKTQDVKPYNQKLEIYPNPFHDYTNIKIPKEIIKNNEIAISVIDLLGKNYSFSYSINNLSEYTEIKIEKPYSLKEGLYFLRVKTPKTEYFEKIIITN